MGLSEIDRNLLERCLLRKPRAWEDFVDRFMGLVVHVVNHTAQAKNLRLAVEDRDDFCADVFVTVVRDDFALLRKFRGNSSLATYLAVVARRIVVKGILARATSTKVHVAIEPPPLPHRGASESERRIDDREEIERLLVALEESEAEIVRLYHLEGIELSRD